MPHPDPIPPIYRLLTLGKRPDWPMEAHSACLEVDSRLKGMSTAAPAEWAKFYRDAEGVGRKGLAALAPAGGGGAFLLPSSTRRLVDGYLAQVRDAPRAVQALWLGRIDRQRDFLLSQAETEADKLTFAAEEPPKKIAVSLADHERHLWEGWLDAAGAKWCGEVCEGIKAELTDQFTAALKPATQQLPFGFLKPPANPEIQKPQSEPFQLRSTREEKPLPSHGELFFRSLRSSLFGVLMIVGILASVIGAIYGTAKSGDLRAFSLLALIPILAILAWRQAASDVARDKETKREEMQKTLKAKILKETAGQLTRVHSQIKSRAERFIQEAGRSAAQWLTEAEFKLNDITEGRQSTTKQEQARLAKELADEILPALQKRIPELPPDQGQ